MVAAETRHRVLICALCFANENTDGLLTTLSRPRSLLMVGTNASCDMWHTAAPPSGKPSGAHTTAMLPAVPSIRSLL